MYLQNPAAFFYNKTEVMMQMLKINELTRIYLGVQQENAARTIQIDMSAWASLFPNATAVILHQRSGDQTKYLTGATYDSNTMILSWTPSEYDTFYDGLGTAEVRMVENEVIKKSKGSIVVAVSPAAIDGTGSVIASNYQAWLNTVLGYQQGAAAAQLAAELAQGLAEDARDAAETAQGLAEDARDAAEDAQDAAEQAILKWPKVDETSHHWLVWNATTGEYTDTGVKAIGEKGDPGDPGTPGHSPVLTSSKSGKVTTIYSDGQQLAQINDGTDGQAGDVIDDTAGAGDTDKTFSADKLVAMDTATKSVINGSKLEDLLLRDELPGTTTTVTMDSNGNPTSIVHTANSETVRTDSFVWSTNSVVETRTLASGKYITITTNLETLAQTISAVQEVA